MSWPKGRPRAPSLPTWKEIRVKLPAATRAALDKLSESRSKAAGRHLGVPIIIAHMLSERLAPDAVSEVREALSKGMDS